jgi:hypothetical protein
MFSRIFIERPRLAAVVSLILLLAGGISLANLPVAEYPEIAPHALRFGDLFRGQCRRGGPDRGHAAGERDQRRGGSAVFFFHQQQLRLLFLFRDLPVRHGFGHRPRQSAECRQTGGSPAAQ